MKMQRSFMVEAVDKGIRSNPLPPLLKYLVLLKGPRNSNDDIQCPTNAAWIRERNAWTNVTITEGGGEGGGPWRGETRRRRTDNMSFRVPASELFQK